MQILIPHVNKQRFRRTIELSIFKFLPNVSKFNIFVKKTIHLLVISLWSFKVNDYKEELYKFLNNFTKENFEYRRSDWKLYSSIKLLLELHIVSQNFLVSLYNHFSKYESYLIVLSEKSILFLLFFNIHV